jgi:hypothetical protein
VEVRRPRLRCQRHEGGAGLPVAGRSRRGPRRPSFGPGAGSASSGKCGRSATASPASLRDRGGLDVSQAYERARPIEGGTGRWAGGCRRTEGRLWASAVTGVDKCRGPPAKSRLISSYELLCQGIASEMRTTLFLHCTSHLETPASQANALRLGPRFGL